MKHVILDYEQLAKRKQAHLYLAQMLEFPDYYGKNLDALYDCLTELGECTIVLKGQPAPDRTDDYGVKVLNVLKEATLANPALHLEIQETEVNILKGENHE